jgi:hypothetical protein
MKNALIFPSVLLGFISGPADAYHLSSITIGTIGNYNVTNYPAAYVESDTWSNTWASDGNTYTISDDNLAGWTGAASGTGYGASTAKLTFSGGGNTITSLVGTLESTMVPQLGTFASNGGGITAGEPAIAAGLPGGGATYKGFGLMSIAGTLYGFWGRQPEYATTSQIFTDEYTTQIISCPISAGCTTNTNWTPMPSTNNNAFTSPMWPLPSTPRVAADGPNLGLFTTPVWVQYGQDYNNASGTLGGFSLNVDGNTTYAYAFGSDGYSFNGSHDYLGRVPIAGGATTIQNQSNWQYYCGPVGGSISASGNWCAYSSISSYPPTATALFNEPFKVGEVGVQYLPVHGRYIAIFTHYPAANSGLTTPMITNTTWDIYEAGTLTGPWTKIQTMVWNPQGYYTPYFIPETLNADGGLTATMLAAGNYAAAIPSGGYYTLNTLPVTFNYALP